MAVIVDEGPEAVQRALAALLAWRAPRTVRRPVPVDPRWGRWVEWAREAGMDPDESVKAAETYEARGPLDEADQRMLDQLTYPQVRAQWMERRWRKAAPIAARAYAEARSERR